MTTEPPPLDVEQILSALTRHGVEFLLVGGVAAIAHGARRLTVDLDCLALRTCENLDRLADALRDLNARLRVEGLDDAEAALLPVRIDRQTLSRMEISTWRTDAGDFDILADLPIRDGRRLRYDDLISRASSQPLHGVTVRVAALDDIIASKEWANRPKDHEALTELRRLAATDRVRAAARHDPASGLATLEGSAYGSAACAASAGSDGYRAWIPASVIPAAR